MDPHDHWFNLSAAGSVTRTVADTALFLDVATAGGGDPGGPAPPGQPFAEAARSVPGRLRIAISERPARAILPPVLTGEVKEGLAETEELLRGVGHDVRRHEPRFGMAGNNFVPRYLAGIRADVDAAPHPDRLEPRTRGFGRLGRGYPAGVVNRAVRAGARDAEKINASWSEFDVLVTPTVGETAVEVGRWDGKGAFRTLLGLSRVFAWTPAWNHTGQPAMALPAGFTAAGMPRSVTLVGRPGDEATLLSLGAQIEAERPWADRRPPVG
jgi:amidase